MAEDLRREPLQLELPWVLRGPTWLRSTIAALTLAFPMTLSAARAGAHPATITLIAMVALMTGTAAGPAGSRLRRWLLEAQPSGGTSLHQVFWTPTIPADHDQRAKLHRHALLQDSPGYRAFRGTAAVLLLPLFAVMAAYCFAKGYVLLLGWCTVYFFFVIELAGSARRNGTVVRHDLLDRLTAAQGPHEEVPQPVAVAVAVAVAVDGKRHGSRWRLVLAYGVYVVVAVVIARDVTPDRVQLPIVATLLAPISAWLFWLEAKPGPTRETLGARWWV